ncbi:hypothetical protein Taro_036585, partial [Colocasia esculenta]|nr:hypothetical protein [Colocasia esculenta]
LVTASGDGFWRRLLATVPELPPSHTTAPPPRRPPQGELPATASGDGLPATISELPAHRSSPCFTDSGEGTACFNPEIPPQPRTPASPTVPDMTRVPGIFTYKNEAYVIPIHRGMEISGILDDVCSRWTIMKDQVELKCRIPDMGNSVMKLLNGGDIDRIIDMHEILGSKMINIEVGVFGSEEVLSIRASAEQSSVNNNMSSNVSGTSSQEMRLRSDLWHDAIHSTGQIFEMNCDFFMWCDNVQSFVDSTTPCEKDEKIKQLENKIAWLEDELRGSKSRINKAKVVVQSLPKTFAFLSIQDKDGDDGSDGDSHSQEDMNVHLH